MTFDTSRFTFNPWNNYNGVVMEQGRVQLDSDWNEWLAELQRRLQAGALDVFGYGNPPHCAVYPATTPFAFQITVAPDTSGVNHVYIGPGRMYVDGLIAENHGSSTTVVWDPALAELSNTPQPPPATLPSGAAIDYTKQPYYPVTALPQGNGPFLAYLDVWTRPVTYLEDPHLIDPAVNVDTTGRLQTIWQVKLAAVPSGSTCSSLASSPPWPGPSIGQLTNGYFPSGSSGPCCLTSGSGYTGLENQLYRVQIHEPGLSAASSAAPQSGKAMATFKWSRDNGSVQTGVTAIQTVQNSLGNNAAQLTVMSLGRDQTLGFAPGNWIEILDDHLEFLGQPGELHLIDTVDFASSTITLVDRLTAPSDFPVDPSTNETTPSRHTRIIRWDQSGQVYLATPTSSNPTGTSPWCDLGANGAAGDIPVPPPGSTLILESGITVSFGPSNTMQFNTGDFWSFAARASIGQIDPLNGAPPFGIHHHYAPLAVVSFSPISFPDCRVEWPPATGGGASCGCCTTYTVGASGDYTSIQSAINALPAAGGEIQLLPGRYYENVLLQGLRDVVIRGCGDQTRVASAVLAPGAAAAASQTAPSTTFNAVISIATSQHIELRGFAVEAAPNEVGILVDGTGLLIANQPGTSAAGAPQEFRANPILSAEFLLGDIDIAIEDMVLTASTLPAILAKRVAELSICDCRIAMANVKSMYAATWLSGEQIEFVRNRVSLQTLSNLRNWLPASVVADLEQDAKNKGSSLSQEGGVRHPGGIQIGGPSNDVLIAENQIVGGLRNGINLGSFSVLDANKGDTGLTPGLTVATTAAAELTLLGPVTYPGIAGSSIVASTGLDGVTIDRNTIAEFGICGIGPVGFFDLADFAEAIAVDALTITNNTVSATCQLAGLTGASAFLGYGAISLATVEDLVIRDNTLQTFGSQPGESVAGIFLLHGETVDISRNQIIDNRDWADASIPDQTGNPSNGMGAIMLLTVTPPTLASGREGAKALAIFEPGLPALRVEENLVRVPMGNALTAAGFGPFAISDNHFSCGGNIPGTATSQLSCVNLINLGSAIELIAPSSPLQAYNNATGLNPSFNAGPSFTSSSGAVLFTNNICQLELREVPQTGFASVTIISFDHLNFSNNHCWLDANALASGFSPVAGFNAAAGVAGAMFTDAFLLAGSLNVTSNRFQEAQNAVTFSAMTVGLLNITSQNLSTYCIFPLGAVVAASDNLAVINSVIPGLCDRFLQKTALGAKASKG